MIERLSWIKRIEEAWEEASIVWLSGVKGVGKTTLVRGLGTERILYVNCDPAQSAHIGADPELFFRACDRPIVVFDDIHRLPEAMTVLRTGADLFPRFRIIAASSTVGTDGKAGDTLGDRRRVIHLGPVLWDELPVFAVSLEKRLHHGGLPEALLTEQRPVGFYREWMDAFFERDIREPFGFRDSDKFNMLYEYLLKQSGEPFETTRASETLRISRPTVAEHLRALQATRAITVVRPFHGRGQKEIIKMPRVYGFDTGFVVFARGWDPLRRDDHDPLWEHVVLEYLEAHVEESQVQYWRWADDRKVDFIVPGARDGVDAIECEWNPDAFDPAGLKLFRNWYPEGNNYIISPITTPAYEKHIAGLDVHICDPTGWLEKQSALLKE
jgi:hypothetical protein